VFDRYDIVNESELRSGVTKLGATMVEGTKQGQSTNQGKVRRIRTAR
jgi:hypothetical protein